MFESFNYDGKLDCCDRPEQIDGPSEDAWAAINAHLGMKPSDLPGLVRELGQLRFGHIPRVDDAFCGGGSVPFEAARLGCEAYGSDLNPVAALLTWGALHIVGGGAAGGRGGTASAGGGLRHRGPAGDGVGHRAQRGRLAGGCLTLLHRDAVLPECGWRVPMAPSWVSGEKTRTIGSLLPDPANRLFEIAIHQGVSKADLLAARQAGTTRDARLHCPNCPTSTPIIALRRDRAARKAPSMACAHGRTRTWCRGRRMCSRSGSTASAGWRPGSTRRGTSKAQALPRTGSGGPLREARVLELLRERFHDWQTKGYGRRL